MLSTESQQKVEKLLLQGNLITKDALEKLKVQALQKNQSLLSVLTDQKLIKEEDLTKLQAQVSGVPYVDLGTVTVKDDILKLLPREVAENYQAVPFGQMQ